MKSVRPVRTLLLDIGGVILSDGWDHHSRKRAALKFGIPYPELEERHRLMFETYEEGKVTLHEYLDHLIFYKKRPFTRERFRSFIFAQSKPHAEMIDFIGRLKERNGLRVAVVNNEAREMNAYRIRKFKLKRLVDCFVSSCFVHLRKPDPDIFLLALDFTQSRADETVFIDNTPLFVRIAEQLGIRSILHKDYETTRKKFASLGLES